MAGGAVALFGPLGGRTSLHVQSICDALEIPHIECHWSAKESVDHLSINLYPKPSSLSRAYVDLVKAWNWKSFAIVYEDNQGMNLSKALILYYRYILSTSLCTPALHLFNQINYLKKKAKHSEKSSNLKTFIQLITEFYFLDFY